MQVVSAHALQTLPFRLCLRTLKSGIRGPHACYGTVEAQTLDPQTSLSESRCKVGGLVRICKDVNEFQQFCDMHLHLNAKLCTLHPDVEDSSSFPVLAMQASRSSLTPLHGVLDSGGEPGSFALNPKP